MSDRLSFLYVDLCRVQQDDNGTKFRVEGAGGARDTYFPAASLAALLLGPGTSITQPAVTALGRAGCAVVFCGSRAVRSYGAFLPPNASTALLERQAQVVSDPVERRRAVARMFAMRFAGSGLPVDGAGASLEQLRGFEGVRMRSFYRGQARKYHLSGWRRNSGHGAASTEPDPVNVALNYANQALYGVTLCAVSLLGMSPGLGLLHTGNRLSFVLDIADLYKTKITIPAAFQAGTSGKPARVMELMRGEFRLLRLLPRMVDDIRAVLDVGGDDGATWDVDEMSLWEGGQLPDVSDG